MASINVTDITVLDRVAPAYSTGFRFEITFDCIAALTDDLEWRVIYVGSHTDQRFDQELDNVLVGPVPLGTSKFVLQTPAPDASRIPDDDLVGATVVLITASYRGHEFVRVGYWIANELAVPLPEGAEMPRPVPAAAVQRSILADKPRVTRFPIDWA